MFKVTIQHSKVVSHVTDSLVICQHVSSLLCFHMTCCVSANNHLRITLVHQLQPLVGHGHKNSAKIKKNSL